MCLKTKIPLGKTNLHQSKDAIISSEVAVIRVTPSSLVQNIVYKTKNTSSL